VIARHGIRAMPEAALGQLFGARLMELQSVAGLGISTTDTEPGESECITGM